MGNGDVHACCFARALPSVAPHRVGAVTTRQSALPAHHHSVATLAGTSRTRAIFVPPPGRCTTPSCRHPPPPPTHHAVITREGSPVLPGCPPSHESPANPPTLFRCLLPPPSFRLLFDYPGTPPSVDYLPSFAQHPAYSPTPPRCSPPSLLFPPPFRVWRRLPSARNPSSLSPAFSSSWHGMRREAEDVACPRRDALNILPVHPGWARLLRVAVPRRDLFNGGCPHHDATLFLKTAGHLSSSSIHLHHSWYKPALPVRRHAPRGQHCGVRGVFGGWSWCSGGS